MKVGGVSIFLRPQSEEGGVAGAEVVDGAGEGERNKDIEKVSYMYLLWAAVMLILLLLNIDRCSYISRAVIVECLCY